MDAEAKEAGLFVLAGVSAVLTDGDIGSASCTLIFQR